ncbi:hypothetical protein SBI_04368 [Streptomyces bingchenggensis BCW-1]|uniref:Uncharacterized protein n=1 Tax=Streptomyces bingchenggensis (strain BCW-1) TaxID=749414 RepID=D7BTP9_STRBB|nr:MULTISPECIES: hypothetical protein [Streptomyces]ADI07488.1 hypothetical protein SBI_04368 [Streptomyces bingchenggensis BCW-1]
MDHARSLWAGAGTIEADREQEAAQARVAEAERAAAEQRAERRLRAVRAVAVGVVWLSAGLTLMFLPMLSISAGSDCGVEDTRFICTGGGQDTVVYIAVYTALVAALAGTWGAFSSRLLGRAVWGASLVALGIAWLVNLLIIH